MGTSLKGVESLEGEISLRQYYGGHKNKRCIEIRKINLTVDQALELAEALIQFARNEREQEREQENASQVITHLSREDEEDEEGRAAAALAKKKWG